MHILHYKLSKIKIKEVGGEGAGDEWIKECFWFDWRYVAAILLKLPLYVILYTCLHAGLAISDGISKSFSTSN